MKFLAILGIVFLCCIALCVLVLIFACWSAREEDETNLFEVHDQMSDETIIF